MTKLTTKVLVSNVSELNHFIFNHGQEAMAKELYNFVEQFETSHELLENEKLAKTYAGLTTCEQKLNKAKDVIRLDATIDNVNKVQKTLDELIEKVKQKQEKKIPFADEREMYLKEKQERLSKMDSELRKEADRIEEYYTKKTRESIYRNLVGI